MAGFGHAANPQEQEDVRVSARNARYGLILFGIYFLFYATFVALNAFWPDVMSRSLAGVSLAVAYGLALIAAAFGLALVYAWLCRGGTPPQKSQPGAGGQA